ncbi:MAG TPA: methyltransferase domain-containing protein, partial [Verrucomicrobiae bacterium]|nr:methyltransferase domain-containing protein [Verrucomicrobiae bacterium]
MANVSYNELWTSKWGDMQHWGPCHRHTMRVIHDDISALSGVRTVLDVGCGSGENLAVLERMNKYELFGSDFSEEALKLSRQCVPNAKLFTLDVEKTHLPEKFDLVMSH